VKGSGPIGAPDAVLASTRRRFVTNHHIDLDALAITLPNCLSKAQLLNLYVRARIGVAQASRAEKSST